MNATRQILEAIGSPYGGYPETPKKDISPRIGFAYDLTGEGRRVLRGGYGFYFDQYNRGAAAGDITTQARRPLHALRVALRVHQADRGGRSSGDRRGVGVVGQR